MRRRLFSQFGGSHRDANSYADQHPDSDAYADPNVHRHANDHADRDRNGDRYSATVTPVGCVGDCSGDGQVTVNELIIMVHIALAASEALACPSGVPSGSSIDIALIIQAVNNALNGCAV